MMITLCCICLENPVEPQISIINCDHQQHFCEHCIQKWLEQKRKHLSCPICRKIWQETPPHQNSDTQLSIPESVSLESLSSSGLDNNHSESAGSSTSPPAYFGILYPTQQQHLNRQTTRRQIYSAFLCYGLAFLIVILVYTMLILISKKFDPKHS